MMKTAAVANRLDKARTIYDVYVKMMKDNGELNRQPYMVYLMFTETLLKKRKTQTIEDYNKTFRAMHQDKLFINSLTELIKNEKRAKRKMALILKKEIKNPYVYRIVFRCV